MWLHWFSNSRECFSTDAQQMFQNIRPPERRLWAQRQCLLRLLVDDWSLWDETHVCDVSLVYAFGLQSVRFSVYMCLNELPNKQSVRCGGFEFALLQWNVSRLIQTDRSEEHRGCWGGGERAPSKGPGSVTQEKQRIHPWRIIPREWSANRGQQVINETQKG